MSLTAAQAGHQPAAAAPPPGRLRCTELERGRGACQASPAPANHPHQRPQREMASYKHLWLAEILSLWCAVFLPARGAGREKELRDAIELNVAHLKWSVASEGLVSVSFPA